MTERFVWLLAIVALVYALTSCGVESFVSTNEVFSEEAQEALQKKFEEYSYARDHPSSLMRINDTSAAVDYTQEIPEEKKQDCSVCSWKMDNFCTTTDAKGNIIHDDKCNDMEYTDQFGMTHKSKGYICSAYGKTFEDGTTFEECNMQKCKRGTITGCSVSELSELTKDVSKLKANDISGGIESFRGCEKRDGIFAPKEIIGANGDVSPYVFQRV